MTSREKLHLLVEEFSDAEADAALTRLVRERDTLTQWATGRDDEDTADRWAESNAREAIREESW